MDDFVGFAIICDVQQLHAFPSDPIGSASWDPAKGAPTEHDYFGLTLSAGWHGSADNLEEYLDSIKHDSLRIEIFDIVKPWRWTDVTLAGASNGAPVGCEILPLPSWASLTDDSGQKFVKRLEEALKKALEEHEKQLPKWCWGPVPPDTNTDPIGFRYADFLASASGWPAELTRGPVKSSYIFASLGGENFVVAPSFKFALTDTTIAIKPAGKPVSKDGYSVWKYEATAEAQRFQNLKIPVAAFVNWTTSTPEPRSINHSLVDFGRLLVKSVPSGPAIASEDWAAGLASRFATLFDLPQRLLEWARVKLNNEAGVITDEFVTAVLATARDLASSGEKKNLYEASILKSVLRRWEREHGTDLAAPKDLESVIAAFKMTWPDWSEVAGSVVGVDSWRAVVDGPGNADERVRLERLTKLVQAIRDPERLPDLVVAQWRRAIEREKVDAATKEFFRKHQPTFRAMLSEGDLLGRMAKSVIAPVFGEIVGSRSEARNPEELAGQVGHALGKYALQRLRPTSAGDAYHSWHPEPVEESNWPGIAEPIANMIANEIWEPASSAARRLSRIESADDGAETPVPHDLAFRVAGVDRFEEEEDTPADGRDEARSVAGYGALLRACVPEGKKSRPTAWRCISLANYERHEEGTGADHPFDRYLLREGGQPVETVAPGRLAYVGDTRQALMTFDGRPMAAKAPTVKREQDRSGKHGDVLVDPLLLPHAIRTIYRGGRRLYEPKPTRLIPPLAFGLDYELLPFAVTNVRALPPELAHPDTLWIRGVGPCELYLWTSHVKAVRHIKLEAKTTFVELRDALLAELAKLVDKEKDPELYAWVSGDGETEVEIALRPRRHLSRLFIHVAPKEVLEHIPADPCVLGRSAFIPADGYDTYLKHYIRTTEYRRRVPVGRPRLDFDNETWSFSGWNSEPAKAPLQRSKACQPIAFEIPTPAPLVSTLGERKFHWDEAAQMGRLQLDGRAWSLELDHVELPAGRRMSLRLSSRPEQHVLKVEVSRKDGKLHVSLEAVYPNESFSSETDVHDCPTLGLRVTWTPRTNDLALYVRKAGLAWGKPELERRRLEKPLPSLEASFMIVEAPALLVHSTPTVWTEGSLVRGAGAEAAETAVFKPEETDVLRFMVRMPSTDFETYDRWIAKDHFVATGSPKQELLEQRIAVRLEHDQQETLAAENHWTRQIEDPAPSSEDRILAFLVMELVPVRTKRPFHNGLLRRALLQVPREPQPTLGLAQTRWSGVGFEIGQASSGLLVEQTTDAHQRIMVRINIKAGEVWELRLYAAVESALFDECGVRARFHSRLAVGRPCVKLDGRSLVLFEPSRLTLEAAHDAMPTSAEVWKALEPKAEGSELIVGWRRSPYDPENPKYPFDNVASVRVGRQAARWTGRPFVRYPFEHLADPDQDQPQSPAAWTHAYLWEVPWFAHRDATDALRSEAPVSLHGAWPSASDDPPLDVLDRKELSSDLTARYYRFCAVARSRYATLLGVPETTSESAVGTTTRWRRYMMPCRRTREVPRPSLMIVVPLMEAFQEGDGTSGTEGPGLLVAFSDGFGVVGGWAECLEAAVKRIDDPGKTEQVANYGPDPIIHGAANPVKDVPLEVQGPIGHSFDDDSEAASHPNSSYIVSRPPSEVDTGSGMVELMFRRVLLPEGCSDYPVGRQKKVVTKETKFAEKDIEEDTALTIERIAPQSNAAVDVQLIVDIPKLPSGTITVERRLEPKGDPLDLRIIVSRQNLRDDASKTSGSALDWEIAVYVRSGPGGWVREKGGVLWDVDAETPLKPEVQLKANADIVAWLDPATETFKVPTLIRSRFRASPFSAPMWAQFLPPSPTLSASGPAAQAGLDVDHYRVLRGQDELELVAREGATSISLVPSGSAAKGGSDNQGLHHYVLVTRRIVDASGDRPQECFVGLYEPLAKDPAKLRPVGIVEREPPPQAELFARILLVQRPPNANKSDEVGRLKSSEAVGTIFFGEPESRAALDEGGKRVPGTGFDAVARILKVFPPITSAEVLK